MRYRVFSTKEYVIIAQFVCCKADTCNRVLMIFKTGAHTLGMMATPGAYGFYIYRHYFMKRNL